MAKINMVYIFNYNHKIYIYIYIVCRGLNNVVFSTVYHTMFLQINLVFNNSLVNSKTIEIFKCIIFDISLCIIVTLFNSNLWYIPDIKIFYTCPYKE